MAENPPNPSVARQLIIGVSTAVLSAAIIAGLGLNLKDRRPEVPTDPRSAPTVFDLVGDWRGTHFVGGVRFDIAWRMRADETFDFWSSDQYGRTTGWQRYQYRYGDGALTVRGVTVAFAARIAVARVNRDQIILRYLECSDPAQVGALITFYRQP